MEFYRAIGSWTRGHIGSDLLRIVLMSVVKFFFLYMGIRKVSSNETNYIFGEKKVSVDKSLRWKMCF